jgi:hypothetical protein
LSKWQNDDGGKPGAGWVIEDGVLTRMPKAGMIWTKERFGDFILDLEFKTKGNSGVFFRTDNPRTVSRPVSGCISASRKVVAPVRIDHEFTRRAVPADVLGARTPDVTVLKPFATLQHRMSSAQPNQPNHEARQICVHLFLIQP